MSWLQPAVVRCIREHHPDLMLIDYEAKLIGSTGSSKRGIDILCLASNGDLVVFELKRGKAGVDALDQALEYARGVSQWETRHVARQRARKQSFGLRLSEVEARIQDHSGGVGFRGGVQVRIVAESFDGGLVERARNLRGGVKLLSFQRLGSEAEFRVELNDSAPDHGDGHGVDAVTRADVRASSPLRHDEKFETWCEILGRNKTDLAEFFRERIHNGAENNSAKNGGQLYFHYKQHGDAWTYVYHVTFRAGGRAMVGRRIGFDDVRALEGDQLITKGTWVERDMSVDELYELFDPAKEEVGRPVGWRR